MKIQKILNRIGLNETKSYKATLETLQLLQKQYLLNIPYENIDFFMNKAFTCKLEKVYEKIVINKRGGICYESHTLFLYLLKNLGFKAKFIFAKVEDLTYIGKDYPHLVILVTINNIDYLVDVANGQSVREPMNIDDESLVYFAEENRYKIKANKSSYTLLVNYKDKQYTPRYHFTKKEITVFDFKNVFKKDNQSTIQDNIPLLVTLAKEDGRITLIDDILIIKNKDGKFTKNISDNNKLEVLKEYFNITIKNF